MFANDELAAAKNNWMCKYEQEKLNLDTELAKHRELKNELHQKGTLYQL